MRTFHGQAFMSDASRLVLVHCYIQQHAFASFPMMRPGRVMLPGYHNHVRFHTCCQCICRPYYSSSRRNSSLQSHFGRPTIVSTILLFSRAQSTGCAFSSLQSHSSAGHNQQVVHSPACRVITLQQGTINRLCILQLAAT